MHDFGLLRRAVLAGALAMSLTGATAGLDGAQALTVAAPLATQPSAAADLTKVVYPYGYRRRFYRRFYRGRAGLYRCGPFGLHTHLSQRACR